MPLLFLFYLLPGMITRSLILWPQFSCRSRLGARVLKTLTLGLKSAWFIMEVLVRAFVPLEKLLKLKLFELELPRKTKDDSRQ